MNFFNDFYFYFYYFECWVLLEEMGFPFYSFLGFVAELLLLFKLFMNGSYY